MAKTKSTNSSNISTHISASKNTIEDATIIKHNHLIEARYHLPLMEQRILLFLIAKFNFEPDFSEQEIKESYLENLKIHISATELLKCFDLSNQGNNFSSMHKACDNLMSFKLDISTTQEILMINVFSSIRYKRGSGSITAVFSHEIMPYLYALKSHFTKYKLTHVAKFKSDYSIRIYELLKMHEFQAVNNKFFKMISMLEFKKILGIEHKYSKFSNFEMDVLKRSQHEINDKSDLSVNYEKIKQGKIIHAIKFMCESKEDVNIHENAIFIQHTHPLLLHPIKKNKAHKVTQKKHAMLRSNKIKQDIKIYQNNPNINTQIEIDLNLELNTETILNTNTDVNSAVNIQQNLIHQFQQANIRPELYQKWLHNYSLDLVQKNFMYTLKQFKNNKIKHIGAYMYKALEHNYALEDHCNNIAYQDLAKKTQQNNTKIILDEQKQKQQHNKQIKKIGDHALNIFNALDAQKQQQVLDDVFSTYPELQSYYNKNQFGGHMPYFLSLSLKKLNLE
jgi:plasmid replication initiation protein